MSQELTRFLTLFDALVVASNVWIERTPEEKMEWAPVDNPNMKFGDRISTINIKSVYVHTIIGERRWADAEGLRRRSGAESDPRSRNHRTADGQRRRDRRRDGNPPR